MSLTRFNDDPARIIKKLQQSTDPGRWCIDVPGCGSKPCFMLDPYIIPQKWGANLWTNCTDVQSNLLGLDRRLTKCGKTYSVEVAAKPIEYPVCETLTTEQSRAVMPHWLNKPAVQDNQSILLNNVQQHAIVPFPAYESTREKRFLFNSGTCP